MDECKDFLASSKKDVVRRAHQQRSAEQDSQTLKGTHMNVEPADPDIPLTPATTITTPLPFTSSSALSDPPPCYLSLLFLCKDATSPPLTPSQRCPSNHAPLSPPIQSTQYDDPRPEPTELYLTDVIVPSPTTPRPSSQTAPPITLKSQRVLSQAFPKP